MGKIKVLVIPSDKGGCGYFRSLRPHTKLAEMYENDFDIDIKYEVDWSDVETMKTYDIIHIHKGLYRDMEAFRSTIRRTYPKCLHSSLRNGKIRALRTPQKRQFTALCNFAAKAIKKQRYSNPQN